MLTQQTIDKLHAMKLPSPRKAQPRIAAVRAEQGLIAANWYHSSYRPCGIDAIAIWAEYPPFGRKQTIALRSPV